MKRWRIIKDFAKDTGDTCFLSPCTKKATQKMLIASFDDTIMHGSFCKNCATKQREKWS